MSANPTHYKVTSENGFSKWRCSREGWQDEDHPDNGPDFRMHMNDLKCTFQSVFLVNQRFSWDGRFNRQHCNCFKNMQSEESLTPIDDPCWRIVRRSTGSSIKGRDLWLGFRINFAMQDVTFVVYRNLQICDFLLFDVILRVLTDWKIVSCWSSSPRGFWSTCSERTSNSFTLVFFAWLGLSLRGSLEKPQESSKKATQPSSSSISNLQRSSCNVQQ